MLKRLFQKWRLWEEAALGIDDLHGDYLVSLERRVARVETAVSELRNAPRGGIRHDDGRV
jgi:hypothetical protein